MATRLVASSPLCSFVKFQPVKSPSQKYSGNASFPKPVIRCVATSTTQVIERRSGNYQPCIWDIEFLQTVDSDYSKEIYKKRSENLKGQVKTMLVSEVEPLVQLELIDVLQRLCLGYEFETEIKSILQSIYNNNSSSNGKYKSSTDLHAAALEFRLLRQHHYIVPQEIFESFRDENGFKKSIYDDVKGMLSLFEASFFAFEDESIMEEAWEFTSEKLKSLKTEDVDPTLAMLVPHALEIPLHWRLPRFDARWFIEVYEKSRDMNPILVELAKLDFNIVQSMYQEDLRVMSSWWKEIALREKLDFARDRLVPSYLWGVGVSSEPQYSYSRRIIGMDIAIINMIDDIYDIYGTLEEVELFTDAVEKWDINAMKQLPDYMKIAYLAFYNTVNEMIYVILKEHGVDVTDHLTKAVMHLSSFSCEDFLLHRGLLLFKASTIRASKFLKSFFANLLRWNERS